MSDRDELARLIDPSMFRPENAAYAHRRRAAVALANRIIAWLDASPNWMRTRPMMTAADVQREWERHG